MATSTALRLKARSTIICQLIREHSFGRYTRAYLITNVKHSWAAPEHSRSMRQPAPERQRRHADPGLTASPLFLLNWIYAKIPELDRQSWPFISAPASDMYLHATQMSSDSINSLILDLTRLILTDPLSTVNARAMDLWCIIMLPTLLLSYVSCRGCCKRRLSEQTWEWEALLQLAYWKLTNSGLHSCRVEDGGNDHVIYSSWSPWRFTADPHSMTTSLRSPG